MAQNPKQPSQHSENQGEGDRKSAERYNKETQEFVKSGKVDEAARKAAGQSAEEAERAEKAGRERAKEEDPEVHRDYRKGEK